MNKIYDKLLLAIAILALLGGIGFFVTNSGDLPSAETPVTFQSGDNPYVSLPRPDSSESEASWPEVDEQEPGVRYDVFTPPAIYIGPDGEFVFQPWWTDVDRPEPTDKLYLASIEREPYRIQLEGYIEEDLKDASKSLLLLFDGERDESVRARIGQTKSESEFKVIDFKIVRNRDDFGNISKVATATIEDTRTGETKVLTHGERLYNDAVTVTIRSEKDASFEVVLSAVGDTFETEIGSYTLTEINLEESAVTVEKQATEDAEAKVLPLELTNPTPAESKKAPEESATDEGSDTIFDAFNL